MLPIVTFPLLDIMPAGKVTLSYAHHLVFLFIGGFMIAVTMERWELHRRIALQVIRRSGGGAPGLVLSIIAYAASIGGVSTLIGTPPNAILAGVLEQNYGIEVSFTSWMLFALPLSVVMLFLTEVTSNTATASLLLPVLGVLLITLFVHFRGAAI